MPFTDEQGNLDFRPKEVKEIDTLIDNKLKEIELKYSDYFKSKKPLFDPYKEHDELKNHIWTYTDNKTFYKFGFNERSDLREEVKKAMAEILSK